ncbi:flagellar hook-basal body complex protein [bacterium]|nr:flagellar hook-basal body complex protein [bacterium]
MSQALFTSMTGLNAAQQQLNVVSNNVANMSTTAFKAADARFSTLFSNTLTAGNAPSKTVGGTNPKQIGLGVQLEGIVRNFTQGSYLATGRSEDQMISGKGYFTVIDPSGNIFLTRDGGFALDADGNLCTATGLKVLGSNTLKSEESSTVSIRVPQTFSAVKAGDKNLTQRYMSELNNGSIIPGKLALKVTNSDNETVNLEVEITEAMLNNTVDNFFGGSSGLQQLINDEINAQCAAASPAITNKPQLAIDLSKGDGTISWKVTDSGSPTFNPVLEIEDTSTTNVASVMGFYRVASGVESTSGVLSYTVDVNPTTSPSNMTSLTSWSTGADGSIMATYDNGDKLTVYLDDSNTFQFQYITSTGVYIVGKNEQAGGLPSAVQINPILCTEESMVLQIANVTNESGLVSLADNLWQPGPDSGKVTYTIAGQMGTGNIQTGGLESSNVDLARELSNMIVAQRAINANSRVFGTASSVLEVLSSLGR